MQLLDQKTMPILVITSNLSKAHVMRDSSGHATWAIGVQHAIKEHYILKEYPNLKLPYERLPEFKKSKLRWLKIYVLCQIIILRFSRSISNHFSAVHSWNVCLSRKLKKKLKPPILWVQHHSKSSMLTPLKSTSLALVTNSSKSVTICNWFRARQAKSGKITNFYRGIPIWCPSAQASLNLGGWHLTTKICV